MDRYITYIDVRLLMRVLDDLDTPSKLQLLSSCITDPDNIYAVPDPITRILLMGLCKTANNVLNGKPRDVFVWDLTPQSLKLTTWR